MQDRYRLSKSHLKEKHEKKKDHHFTQRIVPNMEIINKGAGAKTPLSLTSPQYQSNSLGKNIAVEATQNILTPDNEAY